MFGKTIRDGDLPPGVYERDPITGQLFPTKKLLTNDPPRRLHVSLDGKITDINRQAVDFARDEVEKHYAERARRKGAQTMLNQEKIRELVDRAAESVMRSQL